MANGLRLCMTMLTCSINLGAVSFGHCVFKQGQGFIMTGKNCSFAKIQCVGGLLVLQVINLLFS